MATAALAADFEKPAFESAASAISQ